MPEVAPLFVVAMLHALLARVDEQRNLIRMLIQVYEDAHTDSEGEAPDGPIEAEAPAAEALAEPIESETPAVEAEAPAEPETPGVKMELDDSDGSDDPPPSLKRRR